jgi:hypothetical protein
MGIALDAFCQWAGDQWMAKRLSAFWVGISQIASEQ